MHKDLATFWATFLRLAVEKAGQSCLEATAGVLIAACRNSLFVRQSISLNQIFTCRVFERWVNWTLLDTGLCLYPEQPQRSLWPKESLFLEAIRDNHTPLFGSVGSLLALASDLRESRSLSFVLTFEAYQVIADSIVLTLMKPCKTKYRHGLNSAIAQTGPTLVKSS